jgi:ribosomal protein L44E
LEKGLLEIHNLYTRHEILVKEMRRRNYKRYSEVDENWKFVEKNATLDKEKNVAELVNRCSNCKRRHSQFME